MIVAVDQNGASQRDLIIARTFDAPRERVFDAWSDPAQLSEWWGPNGFTSHSCELDLRTGGAFRTVMRSPEGVEYPTKGVFLEVARPDRLVFTDAYDADWSASDHPFMTAVVTFDETEGKTRCTVRVLHWTAADRARHEEMGFYQGWGESLDRLGRLVTRR